MSEDTSTGGSDDNPFPEFCEGDIIKIGDKEYTISSVDPWTDPDSPGDVRSYYLESEDNESIRLKPSYGRGKWGFVRAASYKIDAVRAVDSGRSDQ